ncbi:MAG: hypothetical protein GXY43_06065 [Clostridiaceae bacterium]|nr:hypothetical protein [Clostridiaceae bacterium]
MDEIWADSQSWPYKRAFLIVPEQTKADMERRFLEVRKQRMSASSEAMPSGEALMLVDVISFHRFAHRILSEVGGLSEEALDSATRSLLIHRVLNENAGDFRILSPIRRRIGFSSQVESVLEDFYRYGLTPDMLRSISAEDTRPHFAEKMHELAILMERLDRLTDQIGCCEKIRPLARLSTVLDEMVSFFKKGRPPWPYRRLEYLSDASVWVTGFGQTRNFTPEESEIIEHLSRVCAKVTVSVCADRKTAERFFEIGGDETARPDFEGFYFGGQAIRLLHGIIPGATLTEVPASKDGASELRCLSEGFLKRERTVYESPAPGITRMLFSSKTEELSFIAGKIKQLVLLHGYRYKDMTVVLCNPRDDLSTLHAVFSEYGMDPFLDKRKRLSDTALMRFVIALLDLGVNGWSFESLMRCVKSGLCHISRTESDKLENYCLKHGLNKAFRIFDEKNFDEGKDGEGPAVFQSVRHALFPIRDTVRSLSAEPRCDRKAIILSAFLESYVDDRQTESGAGQIELLAKEWVEAGDHEAALALVASWNELLRILERLAGPIGETDISLRDMRDAILYSVEASPAGAIPSFVDQVRITDVTGGFRSRCKVLFLVGASREYFPNRAVNEGFLRGPERDLLASSLSVRFPNRSKERAYADFFTAYAILDCPSDQLFISAVDSEEPSSLFRLIGQCFPKALFLDNPHKDFHDPRLFSREALLRYAASIFGSPRSVSDTEKMKISAVLLRENPDFPASFSAGRDLFSVRIPEDIIRERYGSGVRMSVSQIEQYASCPFRHFAGYILRLCERERFEVDVRETGSVAHRIMELALDDYIREIRNARNESERTRISGEYAGKDFGRWAEELFILACSGDSYRVTKDPALIMGSGARMIRIARESLKAVFETIDSDDLTPAETEWAYGEGEENPPIVLEWPQTGRKVSFNGIIDRVDTDISKGLFRVLDYKTGDRRVDFKSLYAGLSVQLPAYLYAYRAANPDLMPTDAGYFILKNPMIRVDISKSADIQETVSETKRKEFAVRGMSLSPDELRLCSEYAVKKIRQTCEKIFSGHFDVCPVYEKRGGGKSTCSYCDYKGICGIDPRRPPFIQAPELPGFLMPDGKKPTDREKFLRAIQGETEETT